MLNIYNEPLKKCSNNPNDRDLGIQRVNVVK